MTEMDRRSVVKGLAAGTAGLMGGGFMGGGLTAAFAATGDDMSKLEPLAQAAVAAKEEPAVWYETTATDLLAPCIATFNKRFPKVGIEHVRGIGVGDMVAKVMQEARAPGKSADLVTTTADQTWGITSRGLALEVNWTDYGMPAKFAPTPYSLICAHSLFCIVYSTNLLSEAQAPKGWEDLLNPSWKGKVGSPAFAQPYAGLVPVWGEPRTTAFVEKFAANGPVITASTYTLAQQCASGELVAAVGLNWTARPTILRGGPIKIMFPDPYPLSTNYSTLPKYARNVNSAKLFACWLATNEGNRAYEAATGRGSLFLDTETAKLKLPTASEFPLDEVPRMTKLIELYNKILRAGGPI